MAIKKALITVSISIGPTSMPLNEFVLFRARQYPNERQYLVVYLPIDNNTWKTYKPIFKKNNIRVFACKGSITEVIRTVRNLAFELESKGFKNIVHLHQPKISFPLLLSKRVMGWPVSTVFTVHSIYKNYTPANKFTSALSGLLADYISFNSDSTFSAYPDWIREFCRNRLSRIYNGIDINKANTKRNSVLPKNEKYIQKQTLREEFQLITVGRLVEAKNQSFLIGILVGLPEKYTLKIIGDGPLNNTLLSLSERLGVKDRIYFTGLIPREKVYQELSRADIFVSSSIWEGLGNAVLEAMAIGLPVVISNIGAYNEIAEYSNSVKVLPLKENIWVEMIKELFEMEQEDLNAIGNQNKEIVDKYFSLERMHKNYTKLYKKL